MSETNEFSVVVTKATRDNVESAILTTKAHTIALSRDGILTVQGELQKRVFRPDMWDSYTVTWCNAQPVFASGDLNARRT